MALTQAHITALGNALGVARGTAAVPARVIRELCARTLLHVGACSTPPHKWPGVYLRAAQDAACAVLAGDDATAQVHHDTMLGCRFAVAALTARSPTTMACPALEYAGTVISAHTLAQEHARLGDVQFTLAPGVQACSRALMAWGVMQEACAVPLVIVQDALRVVGVQAQPSPESSLTWAVAAVPAGAFDARLQAEVEAIQLPTEAPHTGAGGDGVDLEHMEALAHTHWVQPAIAAAAAAEDSGSDSGSDSASECSTTTHAEESDGWDTDSEGYESM
jgi:hypothetical protein